MPSQNYLSLAIIAKLANIDGTKIKYELPIDFREFSNYEVLVGHNIIEGELAAAANSGNIAISANYDALVIIATSHDCNFEITGGNVQLTTFRGKLHVTASGSATSVLTSIVKITNDLSGVEIKYLIATFG